MKTAETSQDIGLIQVTQETWGRLAVATTGFHRTLRAEAFVKHTIQVLISTAFTLRTTIIARTIIANATS